MSRGTDAQRHKFRAQLEAWKAWRRVAQDHPDLAAGRQPSPNASPKTIIDATDNVLRLAAEALRRGSVADYQEWVKAYDMLEGIAGANALTRRQYEQMRDQARERILARGHSLDQAYGWWKSTATKSSTRVRRHE